MVVDRVEEMAGVDREVERGRETEVETVVREGPGRKCSAGRGCSHNLPSRKDWYCRNKHPSLLECSCNPEAPRCLKSHQVYTPDARLYFHTRVLKGVKCNRRHVV